jgi:hypothetical protein
MTSLNLGLGLRQVPKPAGDAPVAPAGFAFLVTRAGNTLVNRDGAYLMRPAQ